MTWTVLVLSAGGPEADSRDLEREADLIRQRLGRGHPANNVLVVAVAVERSQEVVWALAELQPEIVHFSGPGGELILDGGAIGEDELGKLFARAHISPECVLLNAYFTLERADTFLERARCVVGTPAGEPGATARFWTGFYQGLARGEGWATAFELGRAAAAAGLPPGWLPRFASRDPEILDPERGRPRRTAPPTRDVFKGGYAATRSRRDAAPPLRADPLPSPPDTTGGGAGGGPTESAGDDATRSGRERVPMPMDGSDGAGGPTGEAPSVAAAAEAPLYPLGFGTNRALVDANDPTKGFSDEATIQASEKHIARFLLEFTRRSGAEAVHVIAHSMGNRGLLRAMQRILAEVGEETRVPFGQILLAAPDEDQEVFAELSAAYGRLARRTTLFVSARDRAVAGSRLVHDAPRVGFTPPVTVVPGIDTVEVTNADVSLLGHGYFAEARDLLHDIHSLLVHDAPPSSRMGLRPAATPDGRSYWVIGE